MDNVRDSEDDPGHHMSQSVLTQSTLAILEYSTDALGRRFLALTRRKSAAKSDEVLGGFQKALESRKEEALTSLGKRAAAL